MIRASAPGARPGVQCLPPLSLSATLGVIVAVGRAIEVLVEFSIYWPAWRRRVPEPSELAWLLPTLTLSANGELGTEPCGLPSGMRGTGRAATTPRAVGCAPWPVRSGE